MIPKYAKPANREKVGPEKTRDATVTPVVVALDHIQLAMPAGQESVAEGFYSGVLGFARVARPPHLEARGGCWFAANGVNDHLGVDADFVPARKAHPAFVVTSLHEVQLRVEATGGTIVTDTQLNGFICFYVSDPCGNRIEFMEPIGQDV